MRRLFAIFAFVLTGIISCSSCTKHEDTKINLPSQCEDSGCIESSVDSELDSADSYNQQRILNKAVGTTWEFMVPPGWDEVKENVTEQEQAYYVNKTTRGVLFLMKEHFTESLNTYTLYAIRGLRENGSSIVSEKRVIINNVTYSLVSSTKESRTMWLWTTKSSDVCYGFICGGPTSDLGVQLDCFSAANSLKLK